MFVKKKSSELTDDDLSFYINILQKRITYLIEHEGRYPDSELEKEKLRVHDDLHFFFRDDDSMMYIYKEKDEIIGLTAVRTITPDTIFVHQCQSCDISRRVEIMPILLHKIKKDHVGKNAYGLAHKTNKKLRGFILSLGAKETDVFYEKEHPSYPRDKWVSFVFGV